MGIKTIQNLMMTSNPLKKFQKFCIQKSKRKNTVIFVQKDNKNMSKICLKVILILSLLTEKLNAQRLVKKS